jgi:glycosyltransferase involved in cell wall biosynthesis
MNKITAIIAAVNYDDFLEITLFENQGAFDHTIIITDSKDTKTQQLCEKYNVTCFVTDIFYINNNKFNRGMAYNLAFKHLKQTLDWVLLMDADIVVPKNLNEIFFNLNPDKECFYACQRYDIQNYADWISIKENSGNIKNHLLYRGAGYGYFQLFNFKSSTIKNIIEKNNFLIYPPFPTVAEGDWVFRNYWSDWIFDPPLNDDPNQHNIQHKDRPKNPNKLKLLPFNVIHLGQTGKNEFSRVTKRFN